MANRIFDVVSYLREHGTAPKVTLTTASKVKLTMKEHPETYTAAGFRDAAAKTEDGLGVSIPAVSCEGGGKLKGGDRVYGNSAAGLVEGVCGIPSKKEKRETPQAKEETGVNGAAK